jgi:hypothetical protein
MSIPSAGALTFSSLQTEYGGENPIGLGEYYAGGSFVAAGTGGDAGAIPSAGALPIGRFYGSSAAGVLWGSRFIRPGTSQTTYTGGGYIKYLNNKFFIPGDGFNPVITYSTDSTATSWQTIGINRSLVTPTLTTALTTFPARVFDIEWNGLLYVCLVSGFSDSASTTYSQILTSPDLVNWTVRTLPGLTQAKSIAYSGSLFVVAGPLGSMYTSPDGITWTSRTSPNSSLTWQVNQVLWNGFVFVAIAQGYIMYSSDGTTWNLANGTGSGVSFTSVTWGNNTFVACTGNSTLAYTSPNGVTWTSRTTPTIGAISGLSYGAGLFVAVSSSGESMTSPDGITWTYRNFLGSQTGGFAGSGLSYVNNLKSLTFAATKFIGAGSGLVVTSSDGLNWTSLESGSKPATALNAVATNGTTTIAVGDHGSNEFNRTTAKPTLIVTLDGNNWNRIDTNSLTIYTFGNLYDIIWTGTRFVAVGSSQSGAGVLILTSEDGSVWTTRLQNNTSGILSKVAKKGDTLIAVSNASTQEWISTDGGLTWTLRTNDYGYGIAANSSLWVKVTNTGSVSGISIKTSVDGTWPGTNTALGTYTGYRDVNKLVWVNNRFMMCGRNRQSPSVGGFINYSLDGTTWADCVITGGLDTDGINNFYDVSYSFGKYYAVSNRGIFVSTDGVNFSLLSGYNISAGAAFKPLYGITNTSNKIITVGTYGAVVTSPPASTTTL